MITASAAALQHQLSQAYGEIGLDIDIPPMFTDKLSLEQIFGNLLDNAVKYRSIHRPLRIVVRAGVALEPFPFRLNRNGALLLCFVSFSRRKPVSTLLENALDDRVNIEVVDNGRGIADQDRARVFELFRRAGPQDQPREGIGLPCVLTAVRNLGGEIAVTSVLDQGTTFRVVLSRNLQLPEILPT